MFKHFIFGVFKHITSYAWKQHHEITTDIAKFSYELYRVRSRYPIQMSLWSVVRWKLIFGTEYILYHTYIFTYFPSYNISLYSKSFTPRITGIPINQISWFIEKNSNKCLGNVERLNSTYVFVFLYPCRGYYDFSQKIATRWRRRFRPHKVYMFLISIDRQVDLAMSVCPSVSTQTSLSVLKLSVWNFLKSLLSFAGSI